MHTHHEGIVNTWICRFTKKGNYITVFEWDTVERMREMNNEIYHNGDNYYHKAEGVARVLFCVQEFGRVGRPARKCSKKFGEIHLVVNSYRSGVVAHEIQHIVNGYCDFKGWDYMDNNEQIAKLAGDLAHAFWRGYYKCHRS